MSQDQLNPLTPPATALPLVRPSSRAVPEKDVQSAPKKQRAGEQKSDAAVSSTAASNGSEAKGPASIDKTLVEQTRQQIRVLAGEISDLAKSDCTADDFHEGFLTRTTSALASVGGAIWIQNEDGSISLRYQINLKQTGLHEDQDAQLLHHRLLSRLIDRGEPALIGPHSSFNTDENESGNPTDFLLVVGPLQVDNQTVGLVEIFQRPDTGPNTQQGYLKFVSQMSVTAGNFLASQKIRGFAAQQQMWQQLEQFIAAVHEGLNKKQTVYTLANESRRLIGCDRVSVAIGAGRNCRIEAVSGLDSIERRAAQIKNLNILAAAVVKTGQPLWFNDSGDQLPPQIESKLQRYVDQSHTKMLAIVPLMQPEEKTELDQPHAKKRRAKPIGALIIEQISDSRIAETTRQRTDIVVRHGQTALANADRYSSIFLMPLWQALGKLTSAFKVEHRFKTVATLLAVTAAGLFLGCFPYDFGLSANGRLVPQTQFEVFAQTDGTMEEVFVSDTGDTIVQANQLLGRMKNSDIELAISSIRGQIAESETRIAANSQRRSSGKLELNEKTELDTLIETDKGKIITLKEELKIRQEEQAMLNVSSPSAGRVINWNVKQNLTNRPVTQGQNLMTIVPPDAVWELELQMPERRLAHLFKAQKNGTAVSGTLKNSSDDALKVTFGLVSNPGVEYTGQLISVDRKLDVYSDDGNSALVRVAFDNQDIVTELLRTETRVTGKVHCGTRSIGYVMFHELFETVQSKWMLWF
jgi:multidrug resistance efflux pump